MKTRSLATSLILASILVSQMFPFGLSLVAPPAEALAADAPLGEAPPGELAEIPGATEDWWSTVEEQIRQEMYTLTPDTGADSRTAYTGQNLSQGLDVVVSGAGIALAPSAPEMDAALDGVAGGNGAIDAAQSSWAWSMRLAGYGYEGAVAPVPGAAAAVVTGTRVDLAREGISEWYFNNTRGVEQGFVIDAPPAGARARRRNLVLEIAIETDLVLLADAPDAIDYALPGANGSVLRYDELYVTDAAGRELPAHLAADGSRAIRIVIDDDSATYPITVDPLLTTTSWYVVGENTGDRFSLGIGTAGDLNGDGYDDIVVGAEGWNSFAGKTYVYYGGPDGPSTTPGWTKLGGISGAHWGARVGTAGDLNGDGYDDLYVVATEYPTLKGKVYFYLGSPTGVLNSYWSLTGQNDYDHFGDSISTAGDVNGDGYDDLIIGAPSSGYAGQGQAYLYHGSSSGELGGSTKVATWSKVGENSSDYFGGAVSAAGDVNSDGYDDVLIGAFWAANADGRAYIYYGSMVGLGDEAAWSAVGESYEGLGASLGAAGDVNNDGYDDVIIGTVGSGTAYVYHGSASGVGASPSWTGFSQTPGDYYGWSVASAGDVNGDGFDDVVVGALNGPGSWQGAAHVYHGSSGGLSVRPDWTRNGWSSDLYLAMIVGAAGDVNGDGYDDILLSAHGNDSYKGRALLYLGSPDEEKWVAFGEEGSDAFGGTAATAGDVNGDGYGDVLIAAPSHDNDAGKIYLYHGSPTGLDGSPTWVAAGQPGDEFGRAACTAGDVNGDGYDDLIVGAPGDDGDRGRVYVFYGSSDGLDIGRAWSMAGENTGDRLGTAVALAGDVDGDDFGDIVLGAPGYPAGNEVGKAYVYDGSEAGLAGAPEWVGIGEHSGSDYGQAVYTAGDVNDDGHDDVVVGSPGHNADRGRAYVYLGGLEGIEAGAADWTGTGANGGDRYGYSVATAGDVNGDGYAEVLVGAPEYGSSAGRAYVHPGSVTGPGASMYSPTGSTGDRSGTHVAPAGDVDGDGFADMVVGSPGYSYGEGKLIVYLGTSGGPAPFTSSTRSSYGEFVNDHLGAGGGPAGDVNGDGFSDLIVGAPDFDRLGAGDSGKAYLVLGFGDGLGSPKWSVYGTSANEELGGDVGSAGDLNGDGFSDIYVSAGGALSAGRVDVYYGSVTGINVTAPGWSAAEEGSYDWFAGDVAAAGDVNGDGYADLVVGAPGFGGVGKAYLYFGSAAGLSAGAADWSATGAGTFGCGVASAGDVNGDGFSDLIVASDCLGTGKVEVFLGSPTGPKPGPAAWMVTGEATNDLFGYAAESAGDINGDGYADIIIGAPGYGAAGKVYIYYGSALGLAVEPAWTDLAEPQGGMFGVSAGAAGDVNGDGYADVIIGDSSYASNDGKFYVYHGSAEGLDAPHTELVQYPGGGRDFGWDVGTAGDVNGDGYADVIVGAPNPGGTGYGYGYHGSPAGVRTSYGSYTYAWGYSGSPNSLFGDSIGAAGDVNGDGYADVVAGAPGYNVSTGYFRIFLATQGLAKTGFVVQSRGGVGDLPVQPWGVSYAPERFLVTLQTGNPMGRGPIGMEVQVCPSNISFDHTDCMDYVADATREATGGSAVTLIGAIEGLDRGALYKWRARATYDSPLLTHGPWRRVQAQSVEADIRCMDLPTDVAIQKSVDPATPTIGDPITFTLTYSAMGGPAANVVITDILPTSISGVTVASSGAVISDTGVSPGYVWNVGGLAAGEGGVITITGVAESTRLINRAEIATTSPDLEPANNVSIVQTHVPGILYVDLGAVGPVHDGQSWVSAFLDVQAALAVAGPGDEIWVAEGEYRPTDSGDRSASFGLPEGVEIYGGFEGNEVWTHERDWAAHLTVLSGDIGTVGNDSDNTYHVISVTAVTTATVLDGFSVVKGRASGGAGESDGAGMLNNGGSPTLRNVRFLGNYALDDGAGLANIGSANPELIDVVFSGNEAGGEGGGLHNDAGAQATLVNTTFVANSAGITGGALACETGAGADVVNSILWDNAPNQITQGFVGQVTIDHSDIEGGWPGVDNIDADPTFYDAAGIDATPGTLDDDLRLRYTSPVIDIGDTSSVPLDTADLDGDGVITETLSLDISSRSRVIGFTVITPTVDMGAYEATVLDVIAEADGLFDLGESFRLSKVQLLPANTMAAALQNYADFNDGELFYDFCADYGQIDAAGYCPEDVERSNVRNTLLDAIGLYGVALAWPVEEWTSAAGEVIAVRAIGGTGIVESAREIANVHLIFGNEFLVDAIDYRFSTTGIAYADDIINNELDELALAYEQFELTMKLLFRAFGADEWNVGDYFDSQDFETFGVASSRMLTTMDEIAARYRMLGDDDGALALYDQAYEEQYLQITAMAQKAGQLGVAYLQDGSYEMFNTLSRMRDQARGIREGLDFFGFAPDYVPLQSYEQLRVFMEGPTGNTGLLSTARDLEDQARDAQRTYDANAVDMATELRTITKSYNGKLFDLCGPTEDANGDGLPDYDPCVGGLMGKNMIDIDTASLRVGLAWMKAQNIVEKIQIEQDRSSELIRVELGLAQQVTAVNLAIAKLNAYKETSALTSVGEAKVYAGFKAGIQYYAQTEAKASVNPLQAGAEAKSGIKVTFDLYGGAEFSQRWARSTASVWNPSALEIGEWQNVKTLQAAEAKAEIIGAASDATIRNLLLQQSQSLIEYEIALAQFDKVMAEHNQLSERFSFYQNKRLQAADKVAKHNSHLLSPAYRIMRDTLTIQSADAINLAAQFAYLTARAAEYELLTPYPARNDIYKCRTSNDIRIFMDELAVWYQALDRPGQLNRYPYTISLAQDILLLTDDNIDPKGRMSPEQIEAIRQRRFQVYLQNSIQNGELEIWFSTFLDQQRDAGQYLFSPNIWNNRIAGVGSPLPENQGIGINIVTGQGDNAGGAEVVLIHDGQTSYRNAASDRVYLAPDTAIPVGYVLPAELDPENTTVALRPSVNGVGGIPNGGLANLSVAASWWTLRIPADSRGGLDYAQIEDIEIQLDTTGRALPGLAAVATQDADRLQAGLSMMPVSVEPVRALTSASIAPAAVPEPVSGINGTYVGSVVVTSPLTVAVQLLDLNLVSLGGALTGTVQVSETALYHGVIGLTGVVNGDAFTMTSEVISNTVLGRPVERQLTLIGQAYDDGRVIEASYTAVITGLLLAPVHERGSFIGTRPDTPGSSRLSLDVVDSVISLSGSTPVTVTYRDVLMQPISGTTRITLTADTGDFAPAAVDAIDGVAVVTYRGPGTPGTVSLFATDGQITGTGSVRVEGIARVYLPLVAGGGSGSPDLVVQDVVATRSEVQITIENVGTAASSRGFWVDAYINPDTAPSTTNQIWDDLGSQGLVWGVDIAMDVGDVIILTVDDEFYRPLLSSVAWPMAIDTAVYVQADSWNASTTYGSVRESHEIAGEPYDNNLGFARIGRDPIDLNALEPIDEPRSVTQKALPAR